MENERELKELREIVKENNRILRKIQNRFRWAFWGTVLKWIIYIGIAVGAWYYIQPFIEQLRETVTSVQETGGAVRDLKDSAELAPLLEYFGRE